MRNKMPIFGCIAVIAVLLMTFVAPATSASKDGGESKEKTEKPTPDRPNVGDEDSEPPILEKPSASWEELFQNVGSGNAADDYWGCFERQTGHSRAEALQALDLERKGANLTVTLVSNTSVEAGDAQLDSKGLKRDPDVVVMKGFTNTRKGCEAFKDNRAQVRVALTLPDPKDPMKSGLPVVLGHCGNVLPVLKGVTPAPPAVTIPKPNKPTTTVKPRVPGKPSPTTAPPPATTAPPSTAPPTTAKCQKGQPYCDSTGGTPKNPTYGTIPLPDPPTPGANPVRTREAAPNNPENGTFTPPGTPSTPGGDGTQTGGVTGGDNPEKTEASGNPSGGMPPKPA